MAKRTAKEIVKEQFPALEVLEKPAAPGPRTLIVSKKTGILGAQG